MLAAASRLDLLTMAESLAVAARDTGKDTQLLSILNI